MELEPLMEKIVDGSHLSKKEVLSLIEAKKKELSGLVSDIGAAHIVANELGIHTLPSMKQMARIQDLRAGLNNVDLTARVLRIFPKREFERNGAKNIVSSVVIGDETGTTRFSLWGAHALLVDNIEVGDIIGIHGAYVKVDNMARPELRAGSRTKIDLEPDDKRAKEIPELDDIKSTPSSTPDKEIINIKSDETVRLKATLVSLVERSPFYQVCPKCKKSLRGGQCAEHGIANPPERQLILSATLDDGSGSIRAVFFRKAAETLLGMSLEEAVKSADLSGDEKVVFDSAKKKRGQEFQFFGRTKYNERFERYEMVVNKMEPIDAKAEAEKLLETI